MSCLAGFGGVLPHALGLRPPSGESTQMSQILFHRRDAEAPRKNKKHKLSGTSAAGALPELERRGSRDRRDVLSPCHNAFASGPHKPRPPLRPQVLTLFSCSSLR